MLDSITSGLVGVSSRDFFQSTPRDARPKKIVTAKKRPKNRPKFFAIMTTFDCHREYLRNESTYQKSEKLLIICNHSHVTGKNLAYFGPQTKKLLTLIYVHPNGLFSGDYISTLRGCCALKFLHTLEIDQGLLAHNRKGTGFPPPPKNL